MAGGGLFLKGFQITGAFEGTENSYLQRVPAVRHLSQFVFQKPVTCFVGENGTGKSTILEALAICCGFNPEGGSRNFNFSTHDTHSGLSRAMRVVRGIPFAEDGFFLRAESYYNVSTEIERLADGDEGFYRNYGGRAPHTYSHGESFLALIQTRFRGNSILLLDEPESALSPSRQMALLVELHRLVRAGSQFILATHSPILMAYPDADLIELSENGAVRTAYDDIEHVSSMRNFLADPKRMLHYLLQEE